MCTRARCFFAGSTRLKLSAPFVETSPGHPELLGQLIDALAGPHAPYGHALKLPGISLSSLHSCFLSRRVCPSRVERRKRYSRKFQRSEEHTSELQSPDHLVCRLLLEKKNT